MSIKQRILELYNSPDFQALSSYYNKTTIMNVFGIERSENRHSSFLRWLLDNRSSHGLGYAPIKTFLRLYAVRMSQRQDARLQRMLLIGDYDLVYTEYPTTEKTIRKTKGKNRRIDLWAKMELSDRPENRKQAILVLENKVYSKEGTDQTQDYHEYLLQNKADDVFPIEVYLTPSNSPDPDCPEFTHFSYQQLLQTVLEPLANMVHEPSATLILSDYIRNLSKPATGEDGKKFTILATSQLEEDRLRAVDNQFHDLIVSALIAGRMEQIVKRLAKTNALPIVQFLVSSGLVQSILDKATVKKCKCLIEQMEERELLESLWNDNEDLFTAVISVTGLPEWFNNNKWNVILGTSNRDTNKYSIEANGKSYGCRLSKVRAALAIFKAYTERFPSTTLESLRAVFPGSLNRYYSSRLYQHLFYGVAKSDPPFDVRGNMYGQTGDITWDFLNNDHDVLTLDNGNQRAMAVKMWRKEDFDNLINHISSKSSLSFIKVSISKE